MKTFSKLFVVLFFFALAGCASTKQYVAFPDQTKTVDNPEKARVYVLRPEVLGCAISMSVRDQDTLIGRTGGQGYLCWEREPGKTVVTGSAENTSTVELILQKGQAYYIWQEVCMGFVIARNRMQEIPVERARTYLQQCKPPVMEGVVQSGSAVKTVDEE